MVPQLHLVAGRMTEIGAHNHCLATQPRYGRKGWRPHFCLVKILFETAWNISRGGWVWFLREMTVWMPKLAGGLRSQGTASAR